MVKKAQKEQVFLFKRAKTVDHVTVYHDDRLVYYLKDGTEITVEL